MADAVPNAGISWWISAIETKKGPERTKNTRIDPNPGESALDKSAHE
jgi:hypothetical protein